MVSKVSIESLANEAVAQDQAARKSGITKDSYQNFAAKMGMGADNLMSFSTYGFNPITRTRILLEWIHRGSWIGGVAVDVPADDMVRAGVRIKGELKPAQIAAIEEKATELQVWPAIRDNEAWARLYGGSLCVFLVEGQKLNTPLRLSTVGKDQFKGLITLDRWMVEPTLNDLVTEFGPHLGKPKYYAVNASAPALQGQKIHYSRVIRRDGIHLPFQQRMMENLWGISVYERIYDRMVAFDSATTGTAQMIYKAYLRTVRMKDLRENIAAGGTQMDGVAQYIAMMAKFQSIEGITMLDLEDEFYEGGATNFAGLREALMSLMEQVAGGLEMPLVKLFGMSPAGFSTGETDLRMWNNKIQKEQGSKLKIPVTSIYRCIAQSLGIEIPDGFSIEFNSLNELSDSDKANIASQVTSFVSAAREQGVVKPETALQELKQSSEITGYWSNITDDDIKDAEEAGPPEPNTVEAASVAKGGAPDSKNKPVTSPAGGSSKDSASTVAELNRLYGLQVVIENPAGSVRRGAGWESFMPDDYGYIRRFEGSDGDAIDCFVGKDARALNAYVIDQRDLRTGLFDEHKIMFGYPTAGAAVETYLLAHDDGDGDPERVMAVTPFAIHELKEWLASSDLNEPCSAVTHDNTTHDEPVGKIDAEGRKRGSEI
jgi:phage-related protein (TIGR01555 family)